MQKEKDLIELSKGNFLSRRKLDKILNEESPSELRERGKNLRLYINKMETLPLESPSEKIQRKQILRRLLERIDKVIREKEAKMKTTRTETIEEWVKTEIPRHFSQERALRYAYGSEVDGLKIGTHHLNDVQWRPLTSEMVTIQTESGRTLKHNLLQKISPNDWKNILATPLTPHIYNIEKGVVGLKNGKPTGIWNHPKNYQEARKIKHVTHQTNLAVMSV